MVGGTILLEGFELFFGAFIKGGVFFFGMGGVVRFCDLYKGGVEKGVEFSGIDPLEFFSALRNVEVGGVVKVQDV